MQSKNRIRGPVNPDHNLWNNNGTWWCRFTVHHPDYTKERIAKSLGTHDREAARLRRDQLMRAVHNIACRIPIRPPGENGAPTASGTEVRRHTRHHEPEPAVRWIA